MAVILNNGPGCALPPRLIRSIIRVARRALGDHKLPKNAEIGLTLCSDAQIRTLNKKWRGKDCPTDVLSFPLLEGDIFNVPHPGEILLGDIVISRDKARAQSQARGHSFERELIYLFTHGLLHLLGYDHQNDREQAEMRSREEDLLQAAGAGRNGI